MPGAGDPPSFVSAVAGGPVRGSWWGHPKGSLIYQLLNEVVDSREADLLPLIDGKRTFVHRSLFPALYRVVSDAGWRSSKTRGLPSLERRLLEAVGRTGTLRVDEWAHRSSVDAKALRKAREQLAARLLVLSTSLHTDTGNHATVIMVWSRWAKADVKRAAKGLTLEEGRERLQK